MKCRLQEDIVYGDEPTTRRLANSRDRWTPSVEKSATKMLDSDIYIGASPMKEISAAACITVACVPVHPTLMTHKVPFSQFSRVLRLVVPFFIFAFWSRDDFEGHGSLNVRRMRRHQECSLRRGPRDGRVQGVRTRGVLRRGVRRWCHEVGQHRRDGKAYPGKFIHLPGVKLLKTNVRLYALQRSWHYSAEMLCSNSPLFDEHYWASLF